MSSIILNPFQLLEINIISAQDLARVSRSMRTYAIAWVHPDRKLSTRVDSHGRNNPTWNDKFVFRVDEEFLHSDTSGVMIEIYAVHWFKDVLVGTVRVLVGNLVAPSPPFRHQKEIGMRFVALQVRRPSGRPQGILNIGVALLDSSMRSMPLYTQLSTSAVGYRNLMGEHDLHHNQHLLHSYNNHHNAQQQQLVSLSCPKPELRRTKSDTSSMGQGTRTLKRKVSFRDRPSSDVGSAGQDPKKGPRSILSGLDIRGGPTKKGKRGQKGSHVDGTGPDQLVVRSKWFSTEAQQKKQLLTKPKNIAIDFESSNKPAKLVITESELGPSPSEVAAAVAAKDMYRVKDAESSVADGWSLNGSEEGLRSKLERWKMELPPVYDRGEYSSLVSSGNNVSTGRRHVRRHTDGGGGGLFSCVSNICGCECSIVCGE